MPRFSGLVVIEYFNIECMAALKAETQAPLIVDADTVSTRPVAFERFKPAIGRFLRRGGIAVQRSLPRRLSPCARESVNYAPGHKN